VPPLYEQKRIVAKLDFLMAICDELENAEKELDTLESQFAEYLPKSILQVATQGKLVAQDSDDEPATELLKRIKQEKDELIRDGKIKKEKPLPSISAAEIPYDLPDGWDWYRLGELCEINGGYAFKSSNYSSTGVRVVRISDFDERGFIDKNVVRHLYSTQIEPYLLAMNDILIAMTGGTVGKSLLVSELSETMVVNQRVATIKLSPASNPRYIFSVILAPFAQRVINESKNSTNDNISLSDVKKFLIPLPPLAEQQRIVEKVDELMMLYNELKETDSLPLSQKVPNIIPFPYKTVASVVSDKDMDIGIAARGNAKGGLVGQSALDADELLGDE